jgi:hypothetical protein
MTLWQEIDRLLADFLSQGWCNSVTQKLFFRAWQSFREFPKNSESVWRIPSVACVRLLSATNFCFTHFNSVQNMKSLRFKNLVLAAALVAIGSVPVRAVMPVSLFITEVDPAGSGTSTYAADWFELTNTGSTAINITGWKMDDNSNSFGSAVALRGVTSIGAGQSVVFLEGNTSGSNDATIDAAFKAAWFGSNVPAGLVLGGYGGSGVGLSQTSDAVNIFDASGDVITRVDFGADSTNGRTFDNSALLNNVTLTTFSAVGIDGAFNSVTGGEIGSPGLIPEPATYAALAGLAALGVTVIRRKRATTSALA